MKKLISLALPLCAAIFVPPAFGQAEEDQRKKLLDKQIEQAVEALFDDLELQIEAGDGGDVAEELIDPHRRVEVEELHQRLLELQMADQVELLEQGRAAEDVPLDAKVLVNPWADRPRVEVIAGLDHAEFSVRESAEAFLLTDDTLSKVLLIELIEQTKSPEQHQLSLIHI